jgi:cellobiose-specific phosphotransferase system component IIB
VTEATNTKAIIRLRETIVMNQTKLLSAHQTIKLEKEVHLLIALALQGEKSHLQVDLKSVATNLLEGLMTAAVAVEALLDHLDRLAEVLVALQVEVAAEVHKEVEENNNQISHIKYLYYTTL